MQGREIWEYYLYICLIFSLWGKKFVFTEVNFYKLLGVNNL